MAEIQWDQIGERFFETGVDHGVLYLPTAGVYDTGVAWNGLTAVNEEPSGAEPTAQYADNMKYLNLMSTEEFSATIEAFTSPTEFDQCDGSAQLATGVTIGQQSRKTFGFSYRSLIGNDVDAHRHAEKIHLVYGALASPSAKNRQTVNETPEAMGLSWSVSTTPVEVEGFEPTAHLTVDSREVSASGLAALKAVLYGTEADEPRLPLPDEVATLVATP